MIQQHQALHQQCLHLLAGSKHIPQAQLGLKPLPVLGTKKDERCRDHRVGGWLVWAQVWGHGEGQGRVPSTQGSLQLTHAHLELGWGRGCLQPSSRVPTAAPHCPLLPPIRPRVCVSMCEHRRGSDSERLRRRKRCATAPTPTPYLVSDPHVCT